MLRVVEAIHLLGAVLAGDDGSGRLRELEEPADPVVYLKYSH